MKKDLGTIYCKAPALDDPASGFKGYQPGRSVLPKGYLHEPGALELACDIVCERDVCVPMRDGVKLYIDIFRPAKDEKVPALINSSVFGKNGSYFTLDILAGMVGAKNRFGVPKEKLSGLQTWEGADPAFWCNHGYAVINMDIRGIGMSEGDAHYFGDQESDDNYDMVEWLAVQDWCSGKVSFIGNSWLAITQWFVAAKNPPHLTCIAPWEGHGNMYVDEYMRGGIPNWPGVRRKMGYGNQRTEDLPAEMEAYPLMNDFWKDKCADFSRVTVPVYVVASWTSNIHCRGTFDAWQHIASKEKWLRVHNTQEWPDFYDEYHSLDLLRFYDHYMKGVNNGWENTPRVRMAILNPGGPDELDRVEAEFPLKRQNLVKLYLHGDRSAGAEPEKEAARIRYQSDDHKDVVKFIYRFEKETEITGFMNLKLWVEAEEHDDMDIFVSVNKMDAQGNYLYHDAAGMRMYSGPDNRQRVSLRELDPKASTPDQPVHTFAHPQKLSKGEIVPVEIGLWPTSMKFAAGDQLEIAVSGFGYMIQQSEFSNLDFTTVNKGTNIIHCGGAYDSHILVPFVEANE